MITAQHLYNRRRSGEISGTDLHDLFNDLLGDPSPAGATPIDRRALARYAADSLMLVAEHGTQVPAVAKFVLAFL